MNTQDQSFWAARARGYQQLEWATRGDYLSAFLAAGDFQPGDRVLDVGTGTGIIAHALAPHVKEVVGLDLSPDMLARAREHQHANEEFVEGDIRQAEFAPESFDKITARMVFHHVLTDIELALANCYRLLRPGGKLILSEGIPPHPDLKDWYTSMFALKEERRTFLEADLVRLAEGAGFQPVTSQLHISPRNSIRNWLAASGLPDETQSVIYRMHLDLDGLGREHYRMEVSGDDILLDWTYVILEAVKS